MVMVEDDFIFGEEIGRGAFGIVHVAVRKADGKRVAIKKINKRQVKEQKLISRVHSEVKIHSSLSNNNIIKLLSVFTTDEYIFMVLELASTDLFKFIRLNGPLSESTLRPFLRELILGVSYLHSKNIIHRDLKLSNLLLANKQSKTNHQQPDNNDIGNYQLKIADFGLAVQLINKEQKTLCGTPNYISPEIVNRQPYGLASDVWSIGCMIVTILTGSPPFESDLVKNTLQKVTNLEFVCPSYFGDAIKDLVDSLLQKDPMKRPRIEDVIDHQFFSNEYTKSSKPIYQNIANNLEFNLNEDFTNTKHSNHKITDGRQFGSNILKEFNRHNQGHFNKTETLNQKSANKENSNILKSNQQNQNQFDRISTLNRRVSNKNINPLTVSTSRESKVVLEAFNTNRLKPMSKDTKYGSVEILNSGSLLLDFLKEKYIILISKDSEVFALFERGSNPCDSLSIPIRNFKRRDIPIQYHKKYGYALKFMDLIKSKTPKIIFYSPQAKCTLMENTPPNVQITFVSNGTRVLACTRSSSLELTMFDKLNPEKFQKTFKFSLNDLANYNSPTSNSSTHVPSHLWPYLKHAQDCLRQCLEIESEAQGIKTTTYPLILKSHKDGIGMSNINNSSFASLGSLQGSFGNRIENSLPLSSLRPPSLSSTNTFSKSGSVIGGHGDHLEGINSNRMTMATNSSKTRVNNQIDSFVNNTGGEKGSYISGTHAYGKGRPQTVFLEGVGWCVKSGGVGGGGDLFSLLFFDGSSVLLEAKETFLVYIDDGGGNVRYEIDRDLPVYVKSKLAYFPQFMSLIKS